MAIDFTPEAEPIAFEPEPASGPHSRADIVGHEPNSYDAGKIDFTLEPPDITTTKNQPPWQDFSRPPWEDHQPKAPTEKEKFVRLLNAKNAYESSRDELDNVHSEMDVLKESPPTPENIDRFNKRVDPYNKLVAETPKHWQEYQDAYDAFETPVLSAAPPETWWQKTKRSARESRPVVALEGPTPNLTASEGVPDENGVLQYKPEGSTLDREGLIAGASHPFVPLNKIKAKPSPFDNTPQATIKGLYNTALGFAEFAESPLGVATAGVGTMADVPEAVAAGRASMAFPEGMAAASAQEKIRKIIAASFAADMGTGAPEAATRAGELAGSPVSTQEKAEADLQAAAVVLMPGMLAAHAAQGAKVPELKFTRDQAPVAQLNITPEIPAPAHNEFGGNAELGTRNAETPAPPSTPSIESTPSTPSERPDLGESLVVDKPVLAVPRSQIALRPDLMQFKRMTDTETGEAEHHKETLGGKWDPIKGGNLLLWEPADPAQYGLAPGEKYIVADGHGRVNYGDKQDVGVYHSQILREADGVSAVDARIVAAEKNIADGKGTIYDQTKFIRNLAATHGPDVALARAGQAGIAGRRSATIAFAAAPDTFDAFINERLTPDQAEAIARAAPMNGGDSGRAQALQRVGIKAALEGSSPQAIGNLIQAVKLETRSMPAEQFDLFAADDSALKEAERLAGIAGKIQTELSREIRATDAAAKNATTAKAKGLKFEKPPEEILAENNTLKTERNRWDNWALHKDLVDQVRGYAEMDRRQRIATIEEAAEQPMGKGMAASDVKAVLGEISQEFPGIPKTTVVQSMAELPNEYRGDIEGRVKAGKRVPGFYDRSIDHAWIVADWIKNLDHAREVILHETAGHGGMEALLTEKDYRELYDAAREIKPEWTQKMVEDRGLDMAANADRRTLVNELVAEGSKTLGQADPLWRRIVDAMARVLKRAGLLPGRFAAAALDARIRALARRATDQLPAIRRQVRNREKMPGGPQIQDLEFSQENINTDVNGEQPTRQRVQKILASETISPEVKAGVAPDLGYVPRPLATPEAEARAVIQGHGIDEAERAFLNPRSIMPLDTRQALGAQLQEHFAAQERLARAKGDKAQSDYFAGKQVDLWKADAYGTELAQGLNARKLYGQMTSAGMLKQAKELFSDAGEKAWNGMKQAATTVKETLQKANDEAVEAVRNDPEVNRAARAAVDTTVAASPETHRAIVMELAEPFAQSPVILQHAREAVRGKVDELLNQQLPRNRTSEYHRAVLRQLSRAAVTIANGHYQGAEPGVTLKEKLMKRLGLPESYAGRLAKQFDAQFVKMVELAKEKLKERIATQRARRELAMRPQDYISQSRSVWSREKQAASQTLVKAITPSGAGPKTALQEFAGRLTSRLREQLGAGKGTPKAKLDDLAVLREAVTHADKYQEVWDQALHDIQQKFGPDALVGLDPIAKLFGHGQVDRVIRAQLKDMNVKLGALVQQHRRVVDATGKTMGDRVVSASGLTGAEADKLREVFDRRFQELATQRKRAALEQLDKLSGKPPATRQLRSQYEKLIRLTNLGAFEDSKFYDLIKRNLDLPVMTDELAREIAKRANDLEKLPEGNLRDRAATELLNYVARQRGLKLADLPMGIFYSNILSGFTTPAKVALENTNLLIGNTLTSMFTRPRDVLGSPVSFLKSIGASYGRGVKKGGLLAADILKTGIVTGVRPDVQPSSVMELKPFGEKLEPLNLWKYVMREISAVHVSTFKPAMEIKWDMIARDTARREGLSGAALTQRVADLMANTEARVTAAKAQAAGELTALGNKSKIDFHRRVDEILEQQREAEMPGSTELARDWALRSTYLNKPYGFMGLIAEGIRTTLERGRKEFPILGTAAKTQIPFTTIVANILNEKLNWTPIGAVRAGLSLRTGKLYGREMLESSERSELLAKSIVGTAAVGAMAYWFGNRIHGNGPGAPEKRKQLQAVGWIPHSIELNGKYYSYMNTPAALGLAIVGNWMDWHRYGKGNEADGVSRAAFATKATANAIVSQGMLDSLKRFFEALGSESSSEGANKLQKLAARTASAFIVPNALQQIDRFWDPTVYDQTGMAALVKSQIPFVRRENKPSLNVLGEPVQSGPFHYWASKQSADPVWRLIADKELFISEANKNTIIGDKRRGPDHYRALTPDEFYNYVQTSGRGIRAQLTTRMDQLTKMEPDRAQYLVRRIVELERRRALRNFSITASNAATNSATKP